MSWLTQPSILEVKAMWARATNFNQKFAAFERLLNRLPQLTFLFKVTRKGKTYQWEPAYNIIASELKQKYGKNGADSLLGPIAYWRQITHLIGGMLFALLPVLILKLAEVPDYLEYLAMLVPLTHSIVKEFTNDIPSEGMTPKNFLDIFIWGLGGFLTAFLL